MATGLALPANWRIAQNTGAVNWNAGSTSVTQEASTGTPVQGGTYNWGQSVSERAVGAMTSTNFASPNSILAWYQNGAASPITQISISYSAERYRTNTSAASIQFYYSLDGINWTAVGSGDIGSASFPTGTSAYSFATPAIVTVPAFSISGIAISAGASFYLRWNINSSGTTSQGIGVDNISVTPVYAALPTNAGPSGINWIGANQGYVQPTNCDGFSSQVMKYRRINTATNAPTDGRGQWFTTLQAAASGGNVLLSNMTGGAGNGFRFTNGGTCGSAGINTNSWAFVSAAAASLDQINSNNYFTVGGQDMGLNMSIAGYYSFAFRDAGNNDASFYVGFTTLTPVTFTHQSSTQVSLNNDYSISVNATLSAIPSAEEKFYLRYTIGTNDFTAGTAIVQGTVVGTALSFTVPSQSIGTDVYYYLFSSTLSLATLTSLSEGDRSLGALKYADNSNTNYLFTVSNPMIYEWVGTGTGSWSAPSNWNPVGVPVNGDAVLFTNTAAVVVNDVPSIKLYFLSLTNAGTVDWHSTTDVNVDVGFNSVTWSAMDLQSGKQWNLNDPNFAIVLTVKNGFTASVAGTLLFGGDAHRLLGEATGSISFENGAAFVTATGFTGNAFGNTGALNVVHFKSGSSYEFVAGANPFAFGAPNSKVVFEKNSLYKHNATNFPSFSGRTYADVLIMTAAGTSVNNLTGSNGFTMDNITLEPGVLLGLNVSGTGNINGNITVSTGATLSFNPPGPTNIYFNGTGIQQLNGTGQIIVGSAVSMQVQGGHSLYCNQSTISGAGSFTLLGSATLGIGSPYGITNLAAGPSSGNIQTSLKNLNTAAYYLYNGNTNQQTGNALPTTITGTLTIQNTGPVNDNTVTLTNNNTIISTLNLVSGLFAVGVGQTLDIIPSGTINGSGGNISTKANQEGGTIEFLGAATINGTPNFYAVKMSNSGAGVDFKNNPTVYHQLTMGTGAYMLNAPRYSNTTTLVYNGGGTFNRGSEWNNFAVANNPGFPTHVTVDGNTIVDLFTNSILPTLTSLPINGNLALGGDLGFGRMRLNNNMAIPLEIKGNLTIGSANMMASFSSDLQLEDSQTGGDLVLHGDFTRYQSSYFTPYTRSIFLKGNTNSLVQILPAPTPSGGATIDQSFPSLFVQKSNPDNEITLNCTVGINQLLDLNANGIITCGNGNVLAILNKNTSGISGGSASSFVNGTLLRKTNTTAATYSFPVGKKTASATLLYRPMILTTMNNLGANDDFSAEYFSSTGATPSAGTDAIFLSSLQGIMKDDYWQFNRNATSSATGKLAVQYVNPGAGKWRTDDGVSISPCANCNVAIVHRSTSSGPGAWSFTKPDYQFDVVSATPDARAFSETGFIGSAELSSFSPFTIGFGYNAILSALPIHLIAFNASLQNNNGVLTWQVDSDKELLSFEIQHSDNGIHFSKIGQVKPLGTAYSFVHPHLLPGKHFYRLLVKGSSVQFFSKVEVLVAGNANTFIAGLQSTVIRQQVVANIWSSAPQTVVAIITDMAGRMYRKQNSTLIQGQNQLAVPVHSLAKGIYHITILTKDGVQQTLRWLKE
ncbi:MAG TPA: hypothetical protein VLC98_11290 [Phnomibacter sp.]|nr:hypothetical protein [Phnomibacter sp.]